MNTLTKIRILLKPWWAKFGLVVGIFLIGFSWYAASIYLEYRAEEKMLKQLNTFSTGNKQIKLRWLDDWSRELSKYGLRVSYLYINQEDLNSYKDLAVFKHLETIDLTTVSLTPQQAKVLIQLNCHVILRMDKQPESILSILKTSNNITINRPTEINSLARLKSYTGIYINDLLINIPNVNRDLINELNKVDYDRILLTVNHPTDEALMLLNDLNKPISVLNLMERKVDNPVISPAPYLFHQVTADGFKQLTKVNDTLIIPSLRLNQQTCSMLSTIPGSNIIIIGYAEIEGDLSNLDITRYYYFNISRIPS